MKKVEFIFDTKLGCGEASKTIMGDYWTVDHPLGSFYFYGSLEAMKNELDRVLKLSDDSRITAA